jgi:nitroreductase
MSEFDIQQVDALLTTTRAVRKRLDLSRPVSQDLLLECLDIALQAPTGSNGQRWRWLFVTEPDTRAAIAKHYFDVFDEYIAPKKAAADPSDTRTVRMIDSAQYLADHLHEVPVIVIPCALERLASDASRQEHASLWGSICPAIWSFQLALRSRGLGSAWTTLHLQREAEVAKILEIPPTVTQAALLPVAYYTGETFQRAPRRDSAALAYWNRWKATGPIEPGRTKE